MGTIESVTVHPYPKILYGSEKNHLKSIEKKSLSDVPKGGRDLWDLRSSKTRYRASYLVITARSHAAGAVISTNIIVFELDSGS
jgi:hypothetical protein